MFITCNVEAGLARLPRQPGKWDKVLVCLYEKISSCLPGQFCCFDILLTVVKSSLWQHFELSSQQPGL
jgi:hypothetical protein